jgi:hypothetical protein
MFSSQIGKILSRNSHTRRFFIGCYPSDRIPRLEKNGPFPHCMIVNTDPIGSAGSHWCALYVQSPSAVEFYDSLGDWPPLSTPIGEYLAHFPSVQKSEIALQSDKSSACGKHCIYFLVKRCAGIPFNAIISKLLYNRSTKNADAVVSAFVHRLMNNDEHNP